mgnify:CR=1 FL=1
MRDPGWVAHFFLGARVDEKFPFFINAENKGCSLVIPIRMG